MTVGIVTFYQCEADRMSVGVVFEDQLEIPAHVEGFEHFCEWTHSSSFPEKERIDYIDGRIEIEMPPENQGSHASVKSELSSFLHRRFRESGVGKAFIDSMRYTCRTARLSVEPDVFLVTYDSFESGRARFVPSRTDPGDFAEIEGAADLVVEIVSRGSVAKDTKRLPRSYFRAGVREYWLIDARGRNLKFQIFRRGRAGFVRVKSDAKRFQRSEVLGASYRLERYRDQIGTWEYDLIESGRGSN